MTVRGIRNNNPGNLRHNDQWLGLRAEQTDGDFCQFESMAYGCRALIKTLRTYHERHGLCTISSMIRRWAPPCENNTDAYVKFVSGYVGEQSHKKLDFKKDPALYALMGMAIAKMENGPDADLIKDTDWIEGAKMAGVPYV